MCEFCERKNILLSKEVFTDTMLQWHVGETLKHGVIEASEYTIGVFIDRNHLRLVDIDDCSCLDHGEKIKIKYCPMCGSELEE